MADLQEIEKGNDTVPSSEEVLDPGENKEKRKEELDGLKTEGEENDETDEIDLSDVEKVSKELSFFEEETGEIKVEEMKFVDVKEYALTPKDSQDPSYANLKDLPYRVLCRQRYRKAGAKQRAQFVKEIKHHELLQTKALDGVRIHREFCSAIISQPKCEDMITLTREQKIKIEEILARP
ncbi:uncharacterized protein LOC115888929 [Sitophilus oryzae]|uniref:Uncharacterized protein LOC115888929 n=1 Tax=Sitophilus oryzae TaxID=7048 RepID=A0A6J2YMP1_SITOR|nr:uncharacterized protein LOC115888929 [Sitophilus oryzae]